MPVQLGDHATPAVNDPEKDRNVLQAVFAGIRGRCPKCRSGSLFERYLKVRDVCTSCGEELHHHRADDAPPYFTILIVGHVLVPMVLAVEVAFSPPSWVHALIWVPLTLALALSLLPPIKGALVGLQWAFKMHGFDKSGNVPEEPDYDRDLLAIHEKNG